MVRYVFCKVAPSRGLPPLNKLWTPGEPRPRPVPPTHPAGAFFAVNATPSSNTMARNAVHACAVSLLYGDKQTHPANAPPLGPAGLVLESQWTLDDQATILCPLVARKATFLLALILMASPVAGLRPMRAAHLRTCRMPNSAIFTLDPFGARAD